MSAPQIIVALVVVQRLGELLYASANTRKLLARGGIEIGKALYPFIVGLHAAWLAAVFLCLSAQTAIHWVPLGAFVVFQVLRLWVLATLGPFWTTRVITLQDAPLIRCGPYRFFRHPNYAVVVGEIAALPLGFGEITVAVMFSVFNLAILWLRIRQEDKALDSRRRPVNHNISASPHGFIQR